MRLSLVGTVHAESGLANIIELHALIERLEPDVIFAEIPSTYLDRYRDGSHGTLEARAVARYRVNHQIAVIPVDLAKPEDGFFRTAEEMFGKVERTSPDYRRLIDKHTLDTRTGGFSYLNSEHCIRAWTDIHLEVLATLEWIRDPCLYEIYSQWRERNELRDTEMVKHIADYADTTSAVHGAFLVGAAHRESIIDKLGQRLGIDFPRDNEEL